MATPTVVNPANDLSNPDLKHSVKLNEHLETSSSAQTEAPKEASPAETASTWCHAMQEALTEGDKGKIVGLFGEEGWWRDYLTLDFDFNTFNKATLLDGLTGLGVPKIQNLKVVRPDDATVVPMSDELTWIQAFLEFETADARGRGFVRLRESAPGRGDWLAYTFMTALWEIKGHEEFVNARRPLGTFHGRKENVDKNWLDRRAEKANFESQDPAVLIVGGGQNGLMLAARLGALGVDTLIVEKNPRIGDSWRNRYKSLCLHDPIWSDHFPYLSYPPTFPIYLPKDRIANWMEYYAEAMDLNIWTESTINRNPEFDEATGKWSVTVMRNGEKREMKVGHLVLASGFSGEARMPSFPRDEFEGKVCHSSQHKGGQGWEGKKAVVIGACNSSHDICQDFAERGVDVTMVQRSHTYVMSSKHGIPGLLSPFYEEGGPPLDDADLMFTSLPVDLLNTYHIAATQKIAEKDKEVLDGLRNVGFKLNPYPGGLFIKYFRDGGGYYIDVGASQMIANGDIKLKQGTEITKLTKDGVLFADGTELKADIVVCATGYDSIRTTIKRVISDKVAEEIGTCWGQDGQGEIPSVWRYNGVQNFWLQNGNLFQARCFSRWLALQIQMTELGLAKKPSQYREKKLVVDQRF